jgi:hypothetical protein
MEGFGMRTRILGFVAAVAMFAPWPATAAPIAYDLIGATADFGVPPTDKLSGTFIFDPADTTLDAVDITVSGATDPGFYNTPYYWISSGFMMESTIGDILAILFVSPLAASSDLLLAVGDCLCTAYSSVLVTGSAVVTPLPSAFPLFGTVLAVGGLLGWLMKRHNASALADV